MTKAAKLIDKDTLGRMRAMLAALPEKPRTRFTNREAVEQMATEIRKAREALGYSFEDLALMLAEHGHEIKPATLRGYLRDVEKTKPAKKSSRKQQAAVIANAAPPAWGPDDIDLAQAEADAVTMSGGSDG